MLLSDNKELFIEMVNDVFYRTGIRQNYIEKDFLAISILKELMDD